MINVMEKLKEVNNVESKGMQTIEELGGMVPILKLTEEPARVWNEKAKKINTRTFISIHRREPKNYDEVLEWIAEASN